MDDILTSTDGVVGAHMLLVEQVQSSILDGIRTTAKEHDRNRRELLIEVKNLRGEWKKTLATFEKTKRTRDAAIKAAEEGRIAFERANNDKNVTKAHVEKLRDEYATRARRTLVCKEEYIQAARMIKDQQRKHYEDDLLSSFDKIQKVEETRIQKTKLHLNEFGLLITSALGEELSSFKEMLAKWNKLLPNVIIQKFIDQIRRDGPFEFPEMIAIDECASTESLGLTALTRLGRVNSRILLTDDPEIIQTRLETLEKELVPLEKQRDGVKVLHELYKSQPELADDKTKVEATKQLEILTDQLECLKLEKDQLQSKLVTLLQVNDGSSERSTRSSSTTPTSPVLWDNTLLGSPAPGAPNSCLSAIETNRECLKKGLSILFPATAIYDFDASDDLTSHELSIKSGERVEILSNEGEWWQAKSSDGRIGFVPHNYVRQS